MQKKHHNPNRQVLYVRILPLPDERKPRVQEFKIGNFSIAHINTPREFDSWGRVKRESYRLEIKTKNRSFVYKRGE